MKMLAGAVALAVLLAQARKDPAPKVGDAAPDFKAWKLGGGKDEAVELRAVVEKEEKPVVLLFGSFT